MRNISVLDCQKFSGIISVVYKHLDSQSAAFALRAHAGQIVDSDIAQQQNPCKLLKCVPVCMSGCA